MLEVKPTHQCGCTAIRSGRSGKSHSLVKHHLLGHVASACTDYFKCISLVAWQKWVGVILFSSQWVYSLVYN